MDHTFDLPNSNDQTRKPVTLTIDARVLASARSMKINTSRAAEAGIAEEVRRARERNWLEDSKSAITAYNNSIEATGVFHTPEWAADHGKV